MLKLLCEIIIDPLGLPLSPIWEYIILIVLGELAHLIAFYISPGGRFGSIIYWISKLPIYIVVWVITYIIISLIKFLIEYWIIFIILILIVVIIIFISLIKNR